MMNQTALYIARPRCMLVDVAIGAVLTLTSVGLFKHEVTRLGGRGSFGSGKVPFLLALSCLSGGSAPAPATDLPFPDRMLLMQRAAERGSDVELMLAVRPDHWSDALTAVKAQNAFIRAEAEEIGYLRVSIRPENALVLSQNSAFEAAGIGGMRMFPTASKPRGAAGTKTPIQPQDKIDLRKQLERPDAERLYTPNVDVGLAKLREKHPTFDGRGTVIALIESFPDVSNIGLQWAKNLRGQRVRKIRSILSAVPADQRSWPYRITLRRIDTKEGRVRVDGRRFLVPTAPALYFGVLDETRYSLWGGNLDGQPASAGTKFDLLWDPSSACARIDFDRDGDFRRESCVGDFNATGSWAYIPNPDKAKRLPFFILSEPKTSSLVLGIPFDHTTWISGAAAGSNLFGGRLTGAAPGAQLVNVLVQQTLESYLEGVLLAARQPEVDAISASTDDMNPLNSGSSVGSILLRRIADHYGKLIFWAAGNSKGVLNSVAEWGAGDGVISVGIHGSRDMQTALFGTTAALGSPTGWSSAGPSESGAIKPDLLAGGMQVLSHPPMLPRIFASEHLTVPSGIEIGNGTSFSGPTAAGVAAALISGARQTGRVVTPAAVKSALLATAEPQDEMSFNEQGRGVIDADAAWSNLQVAAPRSLIEVVAPVRTALSHLLPTPHQGMGLYEREGWSVGMSGERRIVFRRTSGPVAQQTYSLEVLGDTRTFSLPTKIDLPLGAAVPIMVRVVPTREGVHSAIARLKSSDGTQVRDFAMTIVVAREFEEGGHAQFSGTIKGPSSTSFYIRVPKNAEAVRFAASGDPRLQLRLASSFGSEAWVTNALYFQEPIVYPPDQKISVGDEFIQTIQAPVAGVWEVIVQASRPYPMKNALPFKLDVDVVQRVNVPDAQTGSWVPPRRAVGPLMAVRRPARVLMSGSTTQTNKEPYIAEITVPAETERMTVSVQSVPQATDKDFSYMLLLDCSSSSCSTRNVYILDEGRTEVSLDQPHSGRWVLVIDGLGARNSARRFWVAAARQPAESTFCPPASAAAMCSDLAPGPEKRPGELQTECYLFETVSPAFIRRSYEINVERAGLRPVAGQAEMVPLVSRLSPGCAAPS